MRISSLIVAATVALSMTSSVALAEGVSASAASSGTPDTIGRATMDGLQQGKPEKALATFFGANSLANEKAPQMRALVDQINSTISIYGPFGACELAQRKTFGTMVEKHFYVCQHDRYVTRWQLLFVKTNKGWTGGNITFDDRVQEQFD